MDYLPKPVRKLGVLLRLHRRHEYLPRVFSTLKRLGQGREVAVVVQFDRPTTDVVMEANRQLARVPDSWRVGVMQAATALVSDRERFMEGLRAQYEELLTIAPDLDAAMLWDDDMWLTSRGIRELRGHLDALTADRIEIRARFLWDDWGQVNEAFPHHWQAILFRVLPGDDFPLHYTVHCPDRAAQGKCIRMKSPLVNAGYMDPVDRQLTWDMYKRAGKIDAHTLQLVRPPKLERFDGAKPRQPGRN